MFIYSNNYIYAKWNYIYIFICILYVTQSKCTKRWKQNLAIKQLLETLFLSIKICTNFPTDIIGMNNYVINR